MIFGSLILYKGERSKFNQLFWFGNRKSHGQSYKGNLPQASRLNHPGTERVNRKLLVETRGNIQLEPMHAFASMFRWSVCEREIKTECNALEHRNNRGKALWVISCAAHRHQCNSDDDVFGGYAYHLYK